MEKLMRVKDLSEYLLIKEATVYSWVFQKKIPFIRISGRIVRFSKTEIDKWLETKKVK